MGQTIHGQQRLVCNYLVKAGWMLNVECLPFNSTHADTFRSSCLVNTLRGMVGWWAEGGGRWLMGVAGPKRWFDGRFICLLWLARKFSLQLVRHQEKSREREMGRKSWFSRNFTLEWRGTSRGPRRLRGFIDKFTVTWWGRSDCRVSKIFKL